MEIPILFIAVLVDLEGKILLVDQPWSTKFKDQFLVIFVGEIHESFSKS